MSIPINEFKANIEQYLLSVRTEDLFIRLDGDVVMRLTNTKRDRRKTAESLLGVVPADLTPDQAVSFNKYYSMAGDISPVLYFSSLTKRV